MWYFNQTRMENHPFSYINAPMDSFARYFVGKDNPGHGIVTDAPGPPTSANVLALGGQVTSIIYKTGGEHYYYAISYAHDGYTRK